MCIKLGPLMFTYTIRHHEKTSFTLSKCNLQVLKLLCFGKLGSMVLLFNLDSICTCLEPSNITETTLQRFQGSGLRDWQVPVLVSWHTYSWCTELSGKKPDHPPEVDKLWDYMERKRVAAELIIPEVLAELSEM